KSILPAHDICASGPHGSWRIPWDCSGHLRHSPRIPAEPCCGQETMPVTEPAASGDALRDDLRHTVAVHRDSVEGIGDLHGPLLVGDDDELGGVLQLLEHGQQPREVE